MIGAIIKDNIVQNLIVLKETQLNRLAYALQCEIVDAKIYGLQIGDLRTDAGWTRNANGEQIILQPQEAESYETYNLQQEKIIELESTQSLIAEETTNEVLAILAGEDEMV